MLPLSRPDQSFFHKPDDEKLKRNKEGDGDPCSKPLLCLSLRSFFLASGLRKNQTQHTICILLSECHTERRVNLKRVCKNALSSLNFSAREPWALS